MATHNYRNFRIGLLLSALCALTIFVISAFYGKTNSFLLLNNDLGIVGDYFFNFFTYLGDGLLWIPMLIFFIYSGRKKLLPFFISCFALTTLLTQVCKYLIVPDELRPTTAITGAIIHKVPGVTVWTTASFPSGHSATAFTFYLIFCLISTNTWWIYLGILYALLVGYSRIYLAEHFPFDVAGGIVVAIISASISLLIQNHFNKRNAP